MDTGYNAAPRFSRQNVNKQSRLFYSVAKAPVAFSISAGLIILGFAAGTTLCQALDGGALAAAFFSCAELKIDVWTGLLRSAFFNLALAAAVLLLRVNVFFAPLSFFAVAIKGVALGFAFDAVCASPGGLVMSLFAVLLPSLPTFTALWLMLAGGMTRGGVDKERFLRDLALFLLGALSDGLLSQAAALFIDAAA